MSLFDTVTNMAGLPGSGGGGNAALLQGVLGMLGSSGSGSGLANLVQGFTQNGLGDVVSSWVGTGQNLTISPDQLQAGLGSDRLQQLAQSAGMTPEATAHQLSSILPGVVDRLTPDGTLPQGGQLDQLLGMAKGLFG